MAKPGFDPQGIADLAERFRGKREPPEPPADPLPDPEIDWATFWDGGEEAEWLLDDILARGRGHALYARHESKKSLLMLWCAKELATSGVLTLYFDYEMTEDDVRDRLDAMGCGPETDLSLLRYFVLPELPPLDTAQGAKALLEIVDERRNRFPVVPECAVVIDTISRAVQGEENSNDTIRDFYRHSGLGLKQRGVTWARLDHAGKDADRGQRGGSAKGDDVDVVWHVKPSDGGIDLERVKGRMSWVPQRVSLALREEPVLTFKRVEANWPQGTFECVLDMDRLGIPLTDSANKAQKALRAAGCGRGRLLVLAAVRYRQTMANGGPE